jgi:hypothetical protein
MRPQGFSRLAAMRRLTVLALIAAALALSACGGDEDAKLLPGKTAAEITANLESVKQLAGEGECVGAANAAVDVSTQVEALEGVDPKLKSALQQGAARLNQVVATCEEEDTEAVAPADEETEEEATKVPPGQEKKVEKEREKEEKQLEKEAEKEEKGGPPTGEGPPEEPPPTPSPPPSEGGGTGAPGGVSPGTPVEEGEE